MTKLPFLLGFTPLFWWLSPEEPSAPPPPTAQSLLVQPLMPAGAQLQRYHVYGSSLDELRASMDSRKPQRWDGYTEWRVGWSWPGYGRSDCQLDQARLRTWISVSLPEWRPSQLPPAALRTSWNRYLTELSAHERGHVEIVQRGFAAMQASLKNGECDTVEAELLAIMDEIRQADRDYDHATEHGRLTGARFPTEADSAGLASR